MLDKLMAAFKPKQQNEEEVNKEEPKVEEQQGEKQPEVLDPAVIREWETKLTDYVYDADLAKELAPVFAKLSGVEGFDKVLELLATKEKQIEAISSGSKQQSNPDQKQEQKEVKPQTATDILKARHQKS